MLPVAQETLRNLFNLAPLAQESPTATPVVPTTPVAIPTTAPAATALPLPTATPVPSPWSIGQWLHNSGWVSNFHGVFLVLFVLVTIAAIIAYSYFAHRRFRDHSLNAHLAERVSYALTAFAVVGFLLLFFALAKTPVLSLPLLLIASAVALIAFIIYAVYYYLTVYPASLAKYEREQERQRYIPRARGKGPAVTPPMKRNKKQGKQPKLETKKK